MLVARFNQIEGSRVMDDDTRVRIWARDGFKCRYCDYDAGASFDAFRRASLAVDHLKPPKHGGGNDDANLVTCCAAYNAAKGEEDLGSSVEDVRRYLRLYWAECSRPWFETYVRGGRKDPLSSWDWVRR